MRAKQLIISKNCGIKLFIDKLTAETNRNAQQQRLFWPPPSFVAKWKPVQEKKMLAFLELCLAMGI